MVSSRLVIIGRTFFALALVALGAEHFLWNDFVTGRAPPWPEGWPAGVAWAWLSGGAFVIIGIVVLSGRGAARVAAVAGAALLGIGALVRHLPVVIADSLFAASWTTAGKALTFTGACLLMAATLPPHRGGQPGLLHQDRAFVLAGRITLGIFLVLTGIQHFIFTPFVASLIPAWMPGDPVTWTYIAGVLLVAGGIGMQVPPTARLAALLSGLMVFSWFWIVHLPLTLTSKSSAIALPEALMVSGIAFALAGMMERNRVSSSGAPLRRNPEEDPAS